MILGKTISGKEEKKPLQVEKEERKGFVDPGLKVTETGEAGTNRTRFEKETLQLRGK